MVMQIGQKGEIRVDPRVVREQARQTVRQLIDAVVELVTNSDDSLRRMQKANGEISIAVARLKGGQWQFLEVHDYAEGMSLDQLLGALEYGTRSSGFAKGLPVRGLWGRGMKETILAFGEGTIQTVKNQELSEVKIWWDQSADKAIWEIVKNEKTVLDNQTTVTVFPDEGISAHCPEFDTLYAQLCTHYALRGIIQTRNVELVMNSLVRGARYQTEKNKSKLLRFTPPIGKNVLEKTIKETPFGTVHIKVFESETPLLLNRWDPCSMAGLLIKVGDIPLDNSLFGFEDEVGRYFFGEIDCPQLTRIIKEDGSILTTSRTGINWRQSKSRDFDSLINKVLMPLITKKKTELVSSSAPKIKDIYKKRLLKMLNLLAKQELETSNNDGGIGPGDGKQPITKLTIKPGEASAPPQTERKFSVYVPSAIITPTSKLEIDLQETVGKVDLLETNIELSPYPGIEGLFYGHFTLIGAVAKDSTWVRCRMNDQEDLAYFEVKTVEESEKTNKDKLTGPGGGFYKDILPNSQSNPQQRAALIDGVIYYFTEFPVVREYALSNKLDSSEGKVLFAELVSEVVCGSLARKRITIGLVPGRPNEDIQATIGRYDAEVSRIMNRCSETIHKWAESYSIGAPGNN